MKNIDEMKENFSKGFNSFLSRKELKVLEIAEQTGMNQSTVSCWKTKRSLPDFDKIAKLFEMGMTIHEMFGEKLGDEIVKNTINNKGFTDLSEKQAEIFQEQMKAISENVEKSGNLIKKLLDWGNPILNEQQREELKKEAEEIFDKSRAKKRK